MKKVLIAFFLFISTSVVNAQSAIFKPFKFDLAIGYAIPSGTGAKGGLILSGEPKYAITDNLTAGLRLESALMLRSIKDPNSAENNYEVKASASYLLTGDYYFTTERFRPFIGIGGGLYRTAATNTNTTTSSTTTTTDDIATGNKLGGIGRVGFEYGHFRTAVEYNYVGKTGTFNNNYLGIKLGFFIGGGRIE